MEKAVLSICRNNSPKGSEVLFFAYCMHLENSNNPAQLTVITPLGSSTTAVLNIRKYCRHTGAELKHRRQQLKPENKKLSHYTTGKEDSTS